MTFAREIIEALGGDTAVAAVTRWPIQTINSWKAKGAIPEWRRPRLLALAEDRADIDLTDAAWAYLREAAAA